jgi:hypothetical protein
MKRDIPTPETIHEQIRAARNRFYTEGRERVCAVLTPGPPSAMYLGRHESACIDRYADRYAELYIPGRAPRIDLSNRREYEGMKVFVVDADHHLDFGYL